MNELFKLRKSLFAINIDQIGILVEVQLVIKPSIALSNTNVIPILPASTGPEKAKTIGLKSWKIK